MSKPTRRITRVKVAPGIWKRTGADGRDVFEITYRDSDGRQRRQTVQGGKRAADTALAKIKAAKGSGQRVAPSPRLTFAEAAERWMAARAPKLRPATRDAYRSCLETHLLPTWGKRRLDTFDVDAVASLVERMATAEYRSEVETRVRQARALEGQRVPPVVAASGYKAWSIRRALMVTGCVFDFARRRLGWGGSNPVRELERGERPTQEGKERRILTRDELAAVIAAAPPPYSLTIATAAGLGTRLGETLGLRWQDIDLDTGTASIRHQIDRKTGALVELKTARSRRTIEMPGSLVSALRAHKLASAYSKPDDLVFASRTGGPLEHRNVAQRGLSRACKAAGIAKRWPTFHELRHAHASAWIANGGDIVELSARLGHRDPSVTAAVYSHEFEAAARSDIRRARLDAIYGSAEPATAAFAVRASG